MADSMQTTAPTVAPATVSPATAPTPISSGPVDPNAKSILLVITYLIPIAFIYTMMTKGDKPFFVWHSKNAAAYLLVAIGLNIVFQILWSIIPGLAGILSMVMNLVYLVLFVMVVYFGIVKGSWEGKQTPIPVLTQIGQKLPLEKWFHKGPAPTAAPAAVAPVQAPDPTPTPTPEPAAPVEHVEHVEPVTPTAPTGVVAPVPTPAAPATPEPPSAPLNI